MHIYVYTFHTYIFIYNTEQRTYSSGRDPTCSIAINVFLWRNHKKMNNIFRLVNSVYDMDTYVFKVDNYY